MNELCHNRGCANETRCTSAYGKVALWRVFFGLNFSIIKCDGAFFVMVSKLLELVVTVS